MKKRKKEEAGARTAADRAERPEIRVDVKAKLHFLEGSRKGVSPK